MISANPDFQIIRINCDALGVVLNYPEDAPISTVVNRHLCNTPRGTLGALRNLARSNRRDILEVDERSNLDRLG